MSSIKFTKKGLIVKSFLKTASICYWFEFQIQIIQIWKHGFEFLFDYREFSFIL